MAIEDTEPIEKYLFMGMFGALIAVHSTMLINHLNTPAVPDSLNYAQGGLVAFLAVILIWMVRTPW